MPRVVATRGAAAAASKLINVGLAGEPLVDALDLASSRRTVGALGGGIAGLLAAASDAVQRGNMSGDVPWLLALVERRVEELKPINDHELRLSLPQQWATRIATDPPLRPFLADTRVLAHLDAWGNWNVVEDGGDRELAYALWALHDELHIVGVSVQVNMELCDIARRLGFEWAASERELLRRERQQRLHLVDDHSYASRRDVQRRRRRLAAREGTPWPDGKGRRPGSRNRRRAERLDDLAARYLALPSETKPWELVLEYGADRELVAEHAGRWKLSLPAEVAAIRGRAQLVFRESTRPHARRARAWCWRRCRSTAFLDCGTKDARREVVLAPDITLGAGNTS